MSQTADPDEWVLPDSADEDERLLVARLGEDGLRAIDATLKQCVRRRWLKVARIVVDALDAGGFSYDEPGMLDLHVRRLMALVEAGVVEGQGNLRRPRWSEARLVEASPS